jgi:phospholipase C
MSSKLTRRSLLRAGAPAAVIAPLMQASLARALATPAARRSRTLMDVEHVVILMQENRSFDHYFGTLSGVRGFADPHPATLPSGASVWRQPNKAGGETPPFRFDAQHTNFPVMKSLDHSWKTGHRAWNDGRYDNWPAAKGDLTMGYLTREDIPYHFALADAFTVCDAYFASLQGPTCPNRLYLTTGSVDHHGRGGGPVIANIDITQKTNGVVFGSRWITYAERLQDAGVSWRAYRQGDNLASDDDSDGGMNTLMAFEKFRSSKPGEPLYERGVAPRRLEKLKMDVMRGELAQVSWLYPPRLFCEHPNWPPNYGALYIARILDALTANPDVWNKTVFLVMYDENDGFFDHVPPPVPPLAREQGLSTVQTDDERHPGTGEPYGLGMRVPMLAISPWSKGGWVCSEVFDHTSVIRFLERRFGVHCPDITAWRRTVCGDLTSAFDFGRANTAPVRGLYPAPTSEPLPDQDQFVKFKSGFNDKPAPVPPSEEAMPRVEPGVRLLRSSGYALAVHSISEADRLMLSFENQGVLGAAFSVTDLSQLKLAPRRYTVEPRKSLEDVWPGAPGDQRLVVHGPAGFFRSLDGMGEGLLDIRLVSDLADIVTLTVSNRGPTDRLLNVTDGYNGATIHLRARAGATVHCHFNIAKSGHWYDLSVAAPGLKHRYCGHVETGMPSTTDPNISRLASAQSAPVHI